MAGLKKIWMVVAGCFFMVVAKAQDTPVTAATIDTLALYDEMMAELQTLGFLNAPDSSFFDINAGFGNGNYALQSEKTTTGNARMVYNAGLGYYHKSGLSVSTGINVGKDSNTYRVLQGFVAPAYDYYGKKVKAGIAFYRYINNKNTVGYLSPLVNEAYAYVQYRGWWLKPKLAADFGWGNWQQVSTTVAKMNNSRNNRLKDLAERLKREQQTSVRPYDFSLIFSVKHDFYFKAGKQLAMLYSPAVSATAGTSKYGSNTATASLGGRQFTSQNYAQLLSGATTTNPFQLYNTSLVQNVQAGYKNVYLYSQLIFSYTIPTGMQGWSTFFNGGIGVSF